MYIPLVLFCSTAAVAIVLLRGGYMVQEQVLQIATLSAFTTYAVGIFEPIQMTAANIAEFISLQASIERVTGLLDEKPQIADTPESSPATAMPSTPSAKTGSRCAATSSSATSPSAIRTAVRTCCRTSR